MGSPWVPACIPLRSGNRTGPSCPVILFYSLSSLPALAHVSRKIPHEICIDGGISNVVVCPSYVLVFVT